MAHDRAGHPDRAASLRGSAGRTMANGVPKPGARDLASVSAGPIEDWLVCQIVRREALGAAAGAPVTTRRAAAVAGN